MCSRGWGIRGSGRARWALIHRRRVSGGLSEKTASKLSSEVVKLGKELWEDVERTREA